jgi:hypothetical protein
VPAPCGETVAHACSSVVDKVAKVILSHFDRAKPEKFRKFDGRTSPHPAIYAI